MRAAIATEIDNAAEGLRRLGVDPQENLGCGSNGCVFGTNKLGRVAKVTRNVNEALVARWIFARGKSVDASLPKIFGIARVDDLFVIEREELYDWEPDDVEAMREAMTLVEDGALKLAEWRDLTPSDTAALKAAVKLAAWGRRNGLTLRDLAPENWGMTIDGYLALRDIGELKVE